MHAKGDGSDFDINIEEADNAVAVAHTLLSRGASDMMEESAAYSLAASSLAVFCQNNVNRTGDDVAVAA
eukprot:5281922-Ditylum_brightwellii.AAC.1